MRVLDHLLRTAALDESAAAGVLRRMDDAARCYHGLNHLVVLWSRHRRFARGTEFGMPEANRLIACAVAFHDLIYEPSRPDNEHRSAELWRCEAPKDLLPAQTDWVAQTIEATANHLSVHDAGSAPARLRLWMLDLDLTPLGEAPAVFAHNTRALRQEFSHLSDAEWEHRRIGFLRMVQAAPRIFRSAPLAAAFEQQARDNIARELRAAG